MAGKSMAPGGGGRFAAMLAAGVPAGAAANAGRAKYGKAEFQAMATAGRKRAAKKRHKKRGLSPFLAAAAASRR